MNASNPPPEPRLRELFLAALEIADPAQRNQFLERACGTDTALREQVHALLAQHKNDSFLEHPAVTAGDSTSEITVASSSADAAAAGRIQVNLPVELKTLRYFGDYELLGEIARGGMGVVYRARQKSLNRVVAVKMILGGQLATEVDVKRFHTEAEAAANLKHPNIVAIHEIGEHEGRHYFSMDLIEGKNLHQVIGGKPMVAPKAAALLKTLAEAVHYAHQRGTLHRDLKPQNVLIDAEGQPHITDFGLAKQMTAGSDLTQSGTVMGSPSYMPPEQATGRQAEIGPATDVYSLGAILYQMLTGKVPFVGATAVETLRQVIELEPVPPAKLNPGAPPDLETVCLKCLEKKSERRYASAHALAEELERFLNHEPILARPSGAGRKLWNWSQKNPWVFAAGFGALVLVLACVAYGLWEKYRFLTWRMTVGKDAPLPDGESPVFLFFKLFPGVCFLLYFAGNVFRKLYRQCGATGAPVPDRQLFIHGALGLAGSVVGLGHLFLQIRSWVWLASPPLMLGMELAGVVCALVLSWMAARMVWEAVGVHETSRFRSTVNTAMDQQVAEDVHRWSVSRLMGLVLWLLFAVGAAVLLLLTLLFEDKTVRQVAIASLLTGIAAGWFPSRAIRRRLRLFTNMFAPAAVGTFLVILAILTLNIKGGNGIAVFTPLGFFCAVLSAAFLGREKSGRKGERPRFPGNPWLEALGGLALFVALFVVFHLVENWRGRREWQRVKTELTAQGESLDFDSFLKPPVADDQNVMAHPYMKKDFTSGLESTGDMLPPFTLDGSPYSLSALKTLRYQPDPAASLIKLVGDRGRNEVIPLLQFTDRPLTEVVAELARHAGLKSTTATNDRPWAKPRRGDLSRISISFTNVTAVQAMDVLAKTRFLTPDGNQWRDTGVLAMTLETNPTLQGFLDWYGRYRNEFAQLEEALRRPRSQLQPNPLRPMGSHISRLVSLRFFAQSYANLAKVHCLLGDADAALHDLRMLRRLMDAAQSLEPPTIVETMIRVGNAGYFTSTMEQTLADGLWPNSYLEKIQRLAEGIDLLDDFSRSLKGDRAEVLRHLDTSIKHDRGQTIGDFAGVWKFGESQPKVQTLLLGFAVPEGWVDQNKAHFARMLQLGLQRLDAKTQRIDVRAYETGSKSFIQELEGNHLYLQFRRLSFIACPNFPKAGKVTVRNSTSMNLTYVALALERHRVSKGAYPDTLDALVPEFAAKLPHDLFDGQPLRYRRTDDGKYLLYSIGWNSKDDGGTMDPPKDAQSQAIWSDEKGDWVWQGVPKR